MDGGASSNTAASSKGKKGDKTRRVWSLQEEEALLQSLKEAVNGGWKTENGFRCGYLAFLEKQMRKVFPQTDLRANPNINSKIHVWKKTHGSLLSMLSRSGIGWNETQNMIEATDEAWESFVKSDPNARVMRYKSWPYYLDWCEIFGCDRATGQKAESFATAVQNVLNMNPDECAEIEVGLDDIFRVVEGDGESMSVTNRTSFTSSVNKKESTKKRKQGGGGEELIVEAINNFSDTVNDLGKRISHDYEMSLSLSKDVLGALEAIPGLTKDEIVVAAELLMEKPKKLALFFNLKYDEKVPFIMRLLRSA